MECNLYRIINESDLDEIITNNTNQLIMLMIPLINDYFSMRSCIINLAIKNQDCFFSIINTNQYDKVNGKYKNMNGQSMTMFFFDTDQIAYIYGSNITIIQDTFYHLKNKISTKLQEIEMYKYQNQQIQQLHNKIQQTTQQKLKQPNNDLNHDPNHNDNNDDNDDNNDPDNNDDDKQVEINDNNNIINKIEK